MKRRINNFLRREKGFTMVELLVVVAILGVLAAVAVPNVGAFIGKGKTEAAETELHNVQTGVTAMMAESAIGELDADYSGVLELNSVKSTKASTGDLVLSNYLTGLGDNPITGAIETTGSKTGHTYAFTQDGTITQTVTTP